LIVPLQFLFATGGCGDLRALLELQQELADHYNIAVAIDIQSGSLLTVTLQNTPAVDLPGEQRESFAHEVAEYVRDHYIDYPTLSTVAVRFVSVTSTGTVTIAREQGVYSFSTVDLGQPSGVMRQ
jgi:hypothetical protein